MIASKAIVQAAMTSMLITTAIAKHLGCNSLVAGGSRIGLTHRALKVLRIDYPTADLGKFSFASNPGKDDCCNGQT